MATNRYFDNTGLGIVDGSTAKASQVNSVTNETNKAFDLVESELNNINVGFLLSFKWATDPQGTEPDPTNYPNQYSAFAYALEGKGWAIGPANSATEADGVTFITHSAKEEADKSEASAIRAEDAADSTSGSESLAREWAENPYGSQITGYPGSYSSLHHSTDALNAKNEAVPAAAEATEARDWANKWAMEAENVAVDDGVNPSGYSAFHWAEKASDIVGGGGLSDVTGTDPIVVTTPLAGVRNVAWAGDASDVGLDQVDNTSDLAKPISTATQAALDLIVASSVQSVGGTSPIVITGTSQNPVVTYTGSDTDENAIWGNITGTLSNQTDLQAALDAKEDFFGNPPSDDYILQSTAAGVRNWRVPPVENKVPVGGDTDQVLAKASPSDWDLAWVDQSGGGGGAGGLEWVAPVDYATAPEIVAESGKGYPLYSLQTLTLPATPAQNDQVGWKDYENNFGQGEAFIDPNGNPIENLGTDTMILNTRGQGGQLTWIGDRWSITNVTELNGGEVLNKPFMHVQEVQPLGGNAGSSVVGDNLRNLNTVRVNEISGASLANNEITLPAGDYYIEAGCAAFRTGQTKAQVKTAAGAVLLEGIGGQQGSSTGPQQVQPVEGRVTLAQATSVILNLISDAVVSSIGLGWNHGQGVEEIYSDFRIWRLDTDLKSITVADPEMYLKKPLFQIQGRTPWGTSDTSLAEDIYNDVPVNTVLLNEISGGSQTGDTFTLPAGTYEIDGTLMVYGAGRNGKSWIRKVSDNSIVLQGQSSGNAAGTNTGVSFPVNGRFVLTETTELKWSVNVSLAGGSYGVPDTSTSIGNPDNIYLNILIRQQDAVVQAPKVYNQPIQAISGAYVTGNVYGGELEYVSASTFNVASVSCMSDDLTQPLALVGPTLVDLGTPVLNTMYNVFLVRTTSAAYEIQVDTDVDGLNLTDITHKRWLGFVRANASGNIIPFDMDEDYIMFSETYYLADGGTSVALKDFSALVPGERCSRYEVGGEEAASEVQIVAMAKPDDSRGTYLHQHGGATANVHSAWLIKPKCQYRGDTMILKSVCLKR